MPQDKLKWEEYNYYELPHFCKRITGIDLETGNSWVGKRIDIQKLIIQTLEEVKVEINKIDDRDRFGYYDNHLDKEEILQIINRHLEEKLEKK